LAAEATVFQKDGGWWEDSIGIGVHHVSGATVLEKGTFPAELLHRKPEMVLDPSGLEDYLEKLRGKM
jgi:hypothetical protein